MSGTCSEHVSSCQECVRTCGVWSQKSLNMSESCLDHVYDMTRQVCTCGKSLAVFRTYLDIGVGHKNHFTSVNFLQPLFGCQMVPAFHKYQFFVKPSFLCGATYLFVPKVHRGDPWAKSIFCLKPNNMGIKSCVFMQQEISCREKNVIFH